MEKKQMIKLIIVYAISLVLIIVAMCYAPKNEKSIEEDFWEIVDYERDAEQTGACPDEDGLRLEVADYGL